MEYVPDSKGTAGEVPYFLAFWRLEAEANGGCNGIRMQVAGRTYA